MATTLKKVLGDGGAGVDKSFGMDSLLEVLTDVVNTQNAIIASLNQLITDYNAEDQADHTDSTATAVTAAVTVE